MYVPEWIKRLIIRLNIWRDYEKKSVNKNLL